MTVNLQITRFTIPCLVLYGKIRNDLSVIPFNFTYIDLGELSAAPRLVIQRHYVSNWLFVIFFLPKHFKFIHFSQICGFFLWVFKIQWLTTYVIYIYNILSENLYSSLYYNYVELNFILNSRLLLSHKLYCWIFFIY